MGHFQYVYQRVHHGHSHRDSDERVDFGTTKVRQKPKAIKTESNSRNLEVQEERPWDVTRYVQTKLGWQVFSLQLNSHLLPVTPMFWSCHKLVYEP